MPNIITLLLYIPRTLNVSYLLWCLYQIFIFIWKGILWSVNYFVPNQSNDLILISLILFCFLQFLLLTFALVFIFFIFVILILFSCLCNRYQIQVKYWLISILFSQGRYKLYIRIMCYFFKSLIPMKVISFTQICFKICLLWFLLIFLSVKYELVLYFLSWIINGLF